MSGKPRSVRRENAAILFFALCICGTGATAQTETAAALETQAREKRAEFQEFLVKVNEYAKLRDSARSGIPGVSKRDTAEKIRKHEELLAEKIQEVRKDAKAGDVFTQNSQKAFRGAIEKASAGKHGKRIERTLAQGDPVKLDLYVNKPYPEKIPITTVPPTLLRHFPKLPKNIEYRIVGDDLVLQDTESSLVVDIFSGAFPNAPPHS